MAKASGLDFLATKSRCFGVILQTVVSLQLPNALPESLTDAFAVGSAVAGLWTWGLSLLEAVDVADPAAAGWAAPLLACLPAFASVRGGATRIAPYAALCDRTLLLLALTLPRAPSGSPLAELLLGCLAGILDVARPSHASASLVLDAVVPSAPEPATSVAAARRDVLQAFLCSADAACVVVAQLRLTAHLSRQCETLSAAAARAASDDWCAADAAAADSARAEALLILGAATDAIPALLEAASASSEPQAGRNASSGGGGGGSDDESVSVAVTVHVGSVRVLVAQVAATALPNAQPTPSAAFERLWRLLEPPLWLPTEPQLHLLAARAARRAIETFQRALDPLRASEASARLASACLAVGSEPAVLDVLHWARDDALSTPAQAHAHASVSTSAEGEGELVGGREPAATAVGAVAPHPALAAHALSLRLLSSDAPKLRAAAAFCGCSAAGSGALSGAHFGSLGLAAVAALGDSDPSAKRSLITLLSTVALAAGWWLAGQSADMPAAALQAHLAAFSAAGGSGGEQSQHIGGAGQQRLVFHPLGFSLFLRRAVYDLGKSLFVSAQQSSVPVSVHGSAEGRIGRNQCVLSRQHASTAAIPRLCRFITHAAPHVRSLFPRLLTRQADTGPTATSAAVAGAASAASAASRSHTLELTAALEAAKQTVAARLRTPLGNPAQLFTALDRALLQVAAGAGEDRGSGSGGGGGSGGSGGSGGGGENSHSRENGSALGDSNGGGSSTTTNPSGRGAAAGVSGLGVRLLVEYTDSLERECYRAYEGTCTGAPVPPVVAAFLRANRRTCESWFSRLHEPLLAAAAAAGVNELVAYRALQQVSVRFEAANPDAAASASGATPLQSSTSAAPSGRDLAAAGAGAASASASSVTSVQSGKAAGGGNPRSSGAAGARSGREREREDRGDTAVAPAGPVSGGKTMVLGSAAASADAKALLAAVRAMLSLGDSDGLLALARWRPAQAAAEAAAAAEGRGTPAANAAAVGSGSGSGPDTGAGAYAGASSTGAERGMAFALAAALQAQGRLEEACRVYQQARAI